MGPQHHSFFLWKRAFLFSEGFGSRGKEKGKKDRERGEDNGIFHVFEMEYSKIWMQLHVIANELNTQCICQV